MDYVELQYERIANLIAVAASNRKSEFINLYITPSRDIIYVVSFTNYVKSQIHLNIISKLFNRKYLAYKSVYNSFDGGQINKDDYETVLGYFYEDMSNFLIYNPVNIRLKVVIDVNVNWMPKSHYNYDEVSKRFLKLAEIASESNFNRLIEVVNSYSLFEVVDKILSKEDMLSKIDGYVVAAILRDSKSKVVSIDGGIYAN